MAVEIAGIRSKMDSIGCECYNMTSSAELATITTPVDGVAKVGIIGTSASNWAKDNTELLYDYVPAADHLRARGRAPSALWRARGGLGL